MPDVPPSNCGVWGHYSELSTAGPLTKMGTMILPTHRVITALNESVYPKEVASRL